MWRFSFSNFQFQHDRPPPEHHSTRPLTPLTQSA
nr:MAG TPA: hypothetical protein [Caudoviricetes sp.]